jgi:plasmid stability protein
MQSSSTHAICMSVMVQIRNVPDTLHRRLKARAAMAGMSLSEYLLGELRRSAETPTREELLERLRSRAPVALDESAADAVRAERDSR